MLCCTDLDSKQQQLAQKQSDCQLNNLLLVVKTSELSRMCTCALHHPAGL
jgi:hypothetical protein